MSFEFLNSLFLLTIVVPMGCFFFGILLSDVLNLHGFKRLHLYVMGIPVGLFVVGLLVTSARVDVETQLETGQMITEQRYGFMQDHPEYMMFAAIVIFMGTSTPSLFKELRGRFANAPQR